VLYVVATPIGNLEDLSARALRTLREVDVIAAEDTRRTRGLLTHFGIVGKDLVALHAHSGAKEIERLAARLEGGASVAIVTDAGTPGVSDPGDALVRAAIALGVRVVPIPGPSATLAALSASGLSSGGAFRFFGFLPRDGRERAEALSRVCDTAEPSVILEAANRVHNTLIDLAAATPERTACVARELTKLHEELVRGPLAELAKDEREWVGEVVLVLGPHDPTARERAIDDDAIEARIDEELAAGGHAKVISERVAAWSGRPKRDIYTRVVRRRSGG
jgi:16S rRNA (cytidine1402-2'-O)-methyltransferase